MEGPVKICFGQSKIHVFVRRICLHMISLHTTFPHNLITDKLVDLIERIFHREVLFILHVMIGMHFSPLMQLEIIICSLVKMCVKLPPFS